jgi:predicted AAA+ superfamily ATPase
MKYYTIIQSQEQEIHTFLAQQWLRKRQQYDQIKPYCTNSITKVIIWPRRAGKSTLCSQLIADMNFGYCNFDDERIDPKTFDGDQFLEDMRYQEKEILFFDEIQNIPHREKMINRLQRQWINMIITWSNSNLLSWELATHLTWRYLLFEVLPFSFSEWLTPSLSKESEYIASFDTYIHQWWYPDPLMYAIPPQLYASTIVQDILSKDIIFRYALRKPHLLKNILLTLYQSITKEYSLRNLETIIQDVSINSIAKYISYFENSYLIQTITPFWRNNKTLSYNKKVYTIDNALLLFEHRSLSQDWWKLLENSVYQHLKRHTHYQIFYYRDANTRKECDFIIKQWTEITHCIQVCYELNNENATRELSGLWEAMKQFNCSQGYIITHHQDSYPTIKHPNIDIIPARRFLLD